ncbi:glycoside hydrolase family 31 protein [Ceraceosorus bombacis]|uniref:Glycoside hydrolase family 31 protein n=1 Tax=Ceraceosorus bombacis TaxID=401625 RepID=A0A0P1BBU0_9BASI|nr:glycoside hydrolase family 31 protein [Ceraceosorus bombacis]
MKATITSTLGSAAALLAAVSSSQAAPAGLSVRQEQGVRASYDVTKCPGYKLDSPINESEHGFTAPLSLAGVECHAYGYDINNLTLSVVYETVDRMHVHIYDTDLKQYQQPIDMLFNRSDSDPAKVDNASTKGASHLEFHMSDNSSQLFEWWITRKGSDGAPLFDTRQSNLPTFDQGLSQFNDSQRNTTAIRSNAMVFENQYLQLSSALPKDASLYGLGERYSGGGIGDSSWRLPTNMLQPFFTLDDGDPLESNMYGYHPIYLETRATADNKTESHVVAFQSTAGLDILRRENDQGALIQYRAIGGTLDFRFFSGSTEAATPPADAEAEQVEATVGASLASRADIGSRQEASNATASDDFDASRLLNNPTTAFEQYATYLGGGPLLVPRWALGLHLLRWGLNTVNDSREMVENMRLADIPLETAWADIDWLQAYRNFAPDPNRWPAEELKAYVEELATKNQHFMQIVDGAMPAAPTNDTDVYLPGTAGDEMDLWWKNANGTDYVGQVWPGYTKWPDSHHPNSSEWWYQSLANLSQTLPNLAVWLDMQEQSSFCIGSCGSNQNLSDTPAYQAATSVAGWPEGYSNTTFGNSGNITVNGTLTFAGVGSGSDEPLQRRAELPSSELSVRAANASDFHYSPADHVYQNATQRFLWDPPYAIHNGWTSSPGPLVDNLNKKTISMEAVSKGGVSHDVHNLEGSLTGAHIHDSLQRINPESRPFIIARSTAPGAGRRVHHWLGDNYSTWQYLAKSIRGVLQFQLFGFFSGSDACGFNRNSNEELCNRWMSLAAFTPFARGHNTQGAISQFPYDWESVANATRTGFYKRYELLPTLYTAIARHSQRGTPAVKSLWVDFPEHFNELKATDTQYMFGPLLVTPVLQPNVTTVDGFFPAAGGAWRNVFDKSAVTIFNKNITIPAPLSSINVHQRPASVLLTHARPAYTTTESAAGPFGLYVNLGDDGSATGDAYVDDGLTPPPNPAKELKFSAKNGSLTGEASGDYNLDQKLDEILLFGLDAAPSNVTVGDRQLEQGALIFDNNTQSLNITGLGIDLNGPWSVTWQ